MKQSEHTTVVIGRILDQRQSHMDTLDVHV